MVESEENFTSVVFVCLFVWFLFFLPPSCWVLACGEQSP